MSDADLNAPAPNRYIASLEEQARVKGAKPYTPGAESVASVFESDEELDEFLAWLYDMRHSDMA